MLATLLSLGKLQDFQALSLNQEPGTETNIYTFLYYLTQGNKTAGKKIFRSGPEIATEALGMGEVTQGEEPEKGEKGIQDRTLVNTKGHAEDGAGERKRKGGLLGGPVADSTLPMQGAQV